jgi:anaerobic selenocysteine-containing dehydrogenase
MINRRKFLKLGAFTATGSSVLVNREADAQTEILKKGGQDFNYLSGTALTSVPTACALCASRCAAIAYTDNDYIVKLEGQPESMRTLGKICAKGQAGYTQVYDPDRILKPMRRTGNRGSGQWEQISWDTALEELTTRLAQLRNTGQPEKFMFHHGWISASADALIKKVFLPAFGTATVADNSCLGQSARITAHELTWGGYEDNWDFDNTRYILNFGSNVMEAHTNHVALSRRLSYALTDKNVKMVSFDVRLSNTAAKSHTWFQLRPGSDAAIVLAMCNIVMQEGLYRGAGEEFLSYCLVSPDYTASTAGKISILKEHLAEYTPEWAEQISGVRAEDIRQTALEFAHAKPGCIISSRGATAHFNGVETERAIQMLAALTGNLDNPGGRCLGVEPEWRFPAAPAAQSKPGHLDILDGFAGEVSLPIHGVGHQVLKMIRASDSSNRPEIYMWYNYNPVFSNGNCQENINILKDETLIPYTVAVTPFYDESAALADLILPDTTWLERYDYETGVSPTQVAEYYIRQPVIPPQGDSRDFKDVCCDIAARLELELGFDSAEDFLRQCCELTPAVSNKAGGFNGMKKWGIWYDKQAEPLYYSYQQPVEEDQLRQDGVILDESTGVYWNWKTAGAGNEAEARNKGYRDTEGAHKGYIGQQFENGVYRGFVPASINKTGYFELYSPLLAAKGLPPLPTYFPIPEHSNLADDELVLTTFRVNVQTLSTTQNCRWLDEINGDNPAWINPLSAASRGIADGDTITLRTRLGEVNTIAKVTENVVPGVVAVSSHGGRWEYGRYASGNKAPFSLEEDTPHEAFKWWKYSTIHPNWIIDNVAEPISGQQRWMDTVVKVSKA